MSIPVEYGTTPPTAPPVVAPPPPPIDKQLIEADATSATSLVDTMTPEQGTQLQERYGALGASGQRDFANSLADKLPGEQLVQLRDLLQPQGGGQVIDAAVTRTGRSDVQQDYAQARAGLADSTVQALGLTPDELKDITKPVADQLDAIAESVGKGDFDTAATQVAALRADAAPLATSVLSGLVAKSSAPQALKDFVADNPQLIGEIVQAAPDAISALAQGDFSGALGGLAGNPALRTEVLTALRDVPAVKQALHTLGDIAVDKLADAGPEVVDAVLKAASGDWKGAALDLARGAAEGSELARSAVAKAAQAVDGLPQPIKNILADPALQDALAGAGADALEAILDGNPRDALASLQDPTLRGALVDVVLKQEPIAGLLKKFDIDPASLKAAGDAVPDLLDAIEMIDSNPVEALKSLASASTAAPELVADLAAKAGEKLDGTGTTQQLLKSIVTDKALMTTLLGNPDLHDAIGDLLGGDVTTALTALGGNEEANQAIATHIAEAKDPATVALRGKLETLGYSNAEDIATIGPVLGQVVELADNLSKGKDADFAAALQTLGEIGRGLPDAQRAAVMDKLITPITSHLPKLSPELEELVKQAAIGMTDPGVAKTFIEGIQALPGDPATFLRNTIATVKTLADDPEVGKAMLDALGSIGDGQSQENGNIGAFFADSDFNQTLIDTDSLGSFLDGVEEILVNGDLVEGMKKLGGTIGNLITDGDEIEIGGQFIGKEVWGHEVGFHLPTIGLKIGDEGLGNMKTLMDRIYAALPQDARTKIDGAIADAADRVVGGTFPGLGDIKNIISDGKELVENFSDNEPYENVLNIAKLLSGVGGLVPGAIGKASDVLGGIVGVLDGVADAADSVRSSLNLADAIGVT